MIATHGGAWRLGIWGRREERSGQPGRKGKQVRDLVAVHVRDGHDCHGILRQGTLIERPVSPSEEHVPVRGKIDRAIKV